MFVLGYLEVCSPHKGQQQGRNRDSNKVFHRQGSWAAEPAEAAAGERLQLQLCPGRQVPDWLWKGFLKKDEEKKSGLMFTLQTLPPLPRSFKSELHVIFLYPKSFSLRFFYLQKNGHICQVPQIDQKVT